MGYYIIAFLHNVSVKEECIADVRRELLNVPKESERPLDNFLSVLALDDETGELNFKDKGYHYKRNPDAVQCWVCDRFFIDYDEIYKWLAERCDEGGEVVMCDVEGNGDVWGCTFDGKGSIRELGLVAFGPWMTAKQSKTRAKAKRGKKQ